MIFAHCGGGPTFGKNSQIISFFFMRAYLSVPKQKNRNFCDDINTTCRRAEGQKAEEEERLRELGYSVAGQKIRKNYKNITKLDPVGSTVRYEMMKRCTGSV